MKNLLFVLLLFAGNSIAQTSTDSLLLDSVEVSSVAIETKHYGDRIAVRWAPTSAKNWFYAMENGYRLERRSIEEGIGEDFVTIQDTIRAWSKEKMEEFITANPENEAVMLPYKAIYLDWENTYYEGTGWVEATEKAMFFDQRYQMSVLAADLYPDVAEAAGFKFVDETIEEGKMYSYRITINHEEARGSATSIAKTFQLQDRPMIFDVFEKEQSIAIIWDKKQHDRLYTGYYIERSEDGDTWKRLLEKPYINALSADFETPKFITYTDKVENYKPYHYRILGVDAFGDVSPPSIPVLARGKDRTPPTVGMLQGRVSEDGSTNLLSWSHEPMSEIKQAVIYKNDPNEKGQLVYNSLETTDITQTVEDIAVAEGMTDYFLVLVDTAGNYATSPKTSLYMKDKTPPLPPAGLKSEVDTSGFVTLTWDEPVDNDVIGYYVYSADRGVNNYIKLNQTKHRYRLYIDSINTALLTEKRFYKVAAIDKGGNIGEYSDILEVNLPDKIPPAPCLFYDYKVDSAGIFLGLLPSSSADVVSYTLYRKKANGTDWKVIKEFDNDPPEIYLDNTVTSAGEYSYKWIAKDEAGLESSPTHSTLNLQAMDNRAFYRPQLRVNKTEENLEIQVAENIPGENFRIQILRALGEGKFRTIRTLKESFQFEDRIIQQNDKRLSAKYVARVLYSDGKKSRFSEEVKGI